MTFSTATPAAAAAARLVPYALNQRGALTRFLEDDHLEIGNAATDLTVAFSAARLDSMAAVIVVSTLINASFGERIARNHAGIGSTLSLDALAAPAFWSARRPLPNSAHRKW